MYKKITALVIICAITLTLAACGSKTDANEKNFGAAMTQYFDKKGNLCISTNRWPVDLTETDFRLKSFSINQMTALEAVGLPSLLAAAAVVPLPENKSQTRSPGREEARITRLSSASGFCVA